MTTGVQRWVENGINPPPRDVCQGWYLRNRANNVELSSLVPAAHLYAIMGKNEVERLVEYFENGYDDTGFNTAISVKQGTEVFDFARSDPNLNSEERRQRALEINNQILKDVIDAKITYPFATSDKTATEALKDANDPDKPPPSMTTDTVLIPLAVMQSQVSTNDYVKESYGGVGIDSINSNLVNASGIKRRMNVSLTFTNPNIIEVNYAYQKLLTLNTKYIVVYGWYNASGGNAVFSPQTTDPTGVGAESFASYPVVVGDIPGEKTIEIDCTNRNTGGFWSAHKVVLNSYNFNANDLGQLEGTFTFLDEMASRLSQTSVSKLAPFIKKLLSSGESLSNLDSFETNDAQNFLGDGLADDIAANQQLIYNGISNLLHNVAGERVGNFLSGLMDKENDSIFGDALNLIERAKDEYADRGFPFGGPGIVQYEVNKKPIVDRVDDDDDDVDLETIYETEYQSRINFYFLGWLTEAVRYGLGALSSDPGRNAYVDDESEIEKFGVNFYYEQLPKDSLFATQYKRLLENTQLKDIKAVNRKIMSYIEETALPPFDPDKEWQEFISSSYVFDFSKTIKSQYSLPNNSAIGRVGGGQLNLKSAINISELVFKKMTWTEYYNAHIENDQGRRRNHELTINTGVGPPEVFPGANLNYSGVYSDEDEDPTRTGSWVRRELREQYGDDWESHAPGLSVWFKMHPDSEIELMNRQKISGNKWAFHTWVPIEYLSQEGNEEEFAYWAAQLRFMVNPQLFINTMKKWWVEARKATLKDIQEKVTDRLFRLEQDGKTILDILNEPIDLDWLTSRHPIAVNRHDGTPHGGAGYLRFFNQNWGNLADYGINTRAIGKHSHSSPQTPDHKAQQARLLHYTTGLLNNDGDHTGIHKSAGRWDPYRTDIPDISDDPLEPTMEMLDMIWQTRAVDGRGDINNYGPYGGGVIYDKITKQSFIPESLYADQGLEWITPIRSLQQEMVELFNQSVVTSEREVYFGVIEREQKNILDVLKPGFTGIDLEEFSSYADLERNEEIVDQIDTLNQSITEKALFMLLVPAVFFQLQEVDNLHLRREDDYKSLLELKSQVERLRYGSTGQFSSTAPWSWEKFKNYLNADWQRAESDYERGIRDENYPTYRKYRYFGNYIGNIDEYGNGYDNWDAYLDAKIEENRNDDHTDYSLIDLDFKDTVIENFRNDNWGDHGAAGAASYFKSQLRAPGHDKNEAGKSLNGLDFTLDTYYSSTIRRAIDNALGSVAGSASYWNPSDTVLKQVQDIDDSGNLKGAEDWFISINNNVLSETNGGVFRENLNRESFKELFDILNQQILDDLAIVRSLKEQMHPLRGPADLAEKTKDALQIIGDYFAKLLSSPHEGQPDRPRAYQYSGSKPPVNFYVETHPDPDNDSKTTIPDVDFDAEKEFRFEILYGRWPGRKGDVSFNSGDDFWPDGYKMGQNSHDIELTLEQKESLVRNNPTRINTSHDDTDWFVTKPDYYNNALRNSVLGDHIIDGAVVYGQQWDTRNPQTAVPQRTIGVMPFSGRNQGEFKEKFKPYGSTIEDYTFYNGQTVGDATHSQLNEDNASRAIPGIQERRANYPVTVWSYVSQFEGLGSLTDSTAVLKSIVTSPQLMDDEALHLQQSQTDNYMKRLMTGGVPINKKYGKYMANLMALCPGNRRILIRKKQRFDGDSTDKAFIDPTYGDALGYFTGGSTYGDIRNKVPESVADIAIRRDVVDNILRPSNHKMNLLEFLLQVTSPSSIAAVGGTAVLALRNLNGVLSIKPLGVAQDGVLEDYSNMVMNAHEEIENDTDDFFGQADNPIAANNLVSSFYIYYKKKFSLVQSVNLAAKADPAYTASQIGNNAKWFDSGFSRNFLEFLGYGSTALEFQEYIKERMKASPEASWLKNDEGTVMENFAESVVNIENLGSADAKITVDANLIQKLPRSFISEFIGFGTKAENELVQYWLRSNASDISSVYRQYLERITITLHGTANLSGFQQLFIDNVLPGIAGVFQIVSVNETVDASGYTTSIECRMQYRVPPKQVLDKNTGEFVAAEE